MTNLSETCEDISIKLSVWADTEARILALASDLSAAQGEPDLTDEPNFFDDPHLLAKPATSPVYDRIKAAGFTEGFIRKIARSSNPETVEKYLLNARVKMGLMP